MTEVVLTPPSVPAPRTETRGVDVICGETVVYIFRARDRSWWTSKDRFDTYMEAEQHALELATVTERRRLLHAAVDELPL